MKSLVAIDGSKESEAALAHAADIADAMNGSITAIHVVDPTVYDAGGSKPISSFSDADRQLILESVEEAEQRGQDLLDDASEFADELGHDIDVELLYGNPIREITDYAEVEGFDALFVGHRGRSERAELMLGSVAKSLVERAIVPITVVR